MGNKNLLAASAIQNVLNQGGAILPLLSTSLQNMPSGRSKKLRNDFNRMELIKHINMWSLLTVLTNTLGENVNTIRKQRLRVRLVQK